MRSYLPFEIGRMDAVERHLGAQLNVTCMRYALYDAASEGPDMEQSSLSTQSA